MKHIKKEFFTIELETTLKGSRYFLYDKKKRIHGYIIIFPDYIEIIGTGAGADKIINVLKKIQ